MLLIRFIAMTFSLENGPGMFRILLVRLGKLFELFRFLIVRLVKCSELSSSISDYRKIAVQRS